MRTPENASARERAYRSLLRCEKDHAYSNLEVSLSLNGASLSPEDRGLYTALVYGVLEREITLDAILSSLSSRPIETLDREAVVLCRIGLYQLLYMDRIPDHAAVSETVTLAPARVKGFVNAILRSFLRTGKRIPMPHVFAEMLSVRDSVPRYLVDLWIRDYGEEQAEKLTASAIRPPRLSLRVNRLKTDVRSFSDLLSARGLAFEPSANVPDILLGSAPISEIEDLIADGYCFVQDEASRACTVAADAKPDDFVLDLCAAPGGKSFSMAIDMEDRGTLVSCDLHANKIKLIEDGARRLGLSILHAKVNDARDPREEWMGKADLVLCDVPCSGFGILAKKPDIRRKRPEDVDVLLPIQRAILQTASRYVKPGGTLVYSTCTLHRAENEDAVRAFLDGDPDFSPVDFKVGAWASDSGTLTFFPDRTGCDGFFVAKMRRSV